MVTLCVTRLIGTLFLCTLKKLSMLGLTRPNLLIEQSLRDFHGFAHPKYNNKKHIISGLEWLCRAQDQAGDGGVAAWYSLLNGWQPSYIETTGYIINTFIDCAQYFQKPELLNRAVQMGDFLVAMQHPLGGYRTVVPSRAIESIPTVFNTGQDLLGLADLYLITKDPDYLNSLIAAVDFLINIQEKDGSWLKYTYGSMKHTYHSRVAWGILKVWQLTGKKSYLKAARKNLDWAAKQQLANGWFKQNHLPLPNPQVPYTHTIAYAIEGFLWSGLLLNDQEYLDIAYKGALPLAQYYLDHGFLPGTFDKNWQSPDRYSCLTGDAQLALVWLELFKTSQNTTFRRAAHQMLEFLKTMQSTDPADDVVVRGAMKGSYPIYGDLPEYRGYCRFAYLNWATKFYVDALLTEQKMFDEVAQQNLRSK